MSTSTYKETTHTYIWIFMRKRLIVDCNIARRVHNFISAVTDLRKNTVAASYL
jgi:hypothetical protein